MAILNQSLKIKKIILSLLLSFSLLVFASKGNKEKITSKYSTDLVGYIGKSPVFMHLKINETDNGDVKYSGFYTYVKIGQKIELKGSWYMRPGTATSIRLSESVKGNITGEFELMPTRYGDYSTLEGEWFGNGNHLKVSLKQIK